MYPWHSLKFRWPRRNFCAHHRYPICGPHPLFYFFNSSLLWDVFIINSVEQLQTLPKTQSEIDISLFLKTQKPSILYSNTLNRVPMQGRIQDFKLGGGALKKNASSGGRRENFGVFRVKNHDFTQKIIFFPILGGGAQAPPLWIRPWLWCLTPLSTIFQLYRGGSDFERTWWRLFQKRRWRAH